MIFVERCYVFQVLYGHIRNKSKVLVNKRVRSVDTSNSDFVSVTTADGSSYTGDIVVGADGVHSTIRQEMARLDTSGRDFREENGEICVFIFCVFSKTWKLIINQVI